MKIIYEPRGKAREYAELACNLYKGCPHGCLYCYGPLIPNPAKKGLTMDEWRKVWHSQSVPKADAMEKLGSDCRLMQKRGDTRPVLLCFACDPYPPDEPVKDDILYPEMTRKALHIMQHYGITPVILTKGGMRAARDFDVIRAAGGWFGQTVSMWDEMAAQWEPNAATPHERGTAAASAHANGIRTWVSVEPVIDTTWALKMVQGIIEYARPDHFKLGKLSGYDAHTRRIENGTDWAVYRAAACGLLDAEGYRRIHTPGGFSSGTYYVKAELADWTKENEGKGTA